MGSNEAIPPAQADALLRYAQATYRATTDLRRRVALITLAVAVVFGLIALWAAWHWLTASAAADAVADAAIVDVMGVRIPDPRPALERGELRVRAFGWSLVGGASALVSLFALGIYWLVRPTRLPPELRALEASVPSAADVGHLDARKRPPGAGADL